jgi:hypothetical protein
VSKLTPESEWLRADVGAAADPKVMVDREAGIVYGHVLAEAGPFKSKGRGEFDGTSLDRIVELAAKTPAGLKSRFTHPTLSGDGLGKFLGRDKNVRRDGDKVRADLHLDRTALDTPPSGGKPLGHYVMDLAMSDPDAFGSSLVLKADKEIRLLSDGTAQKDEKGNALPPLWRPTALRACDVVDEGDAVHGGFLSADADLPESVVRKATELLNEQFPDADRAALRARCLAWYDRYEDLRFGPADGPEEAAMSEAEAAAAPPKPAPAPKPTTPPSNPPASPPAAPKPQPKPAPKGSEEEGRGELSDVPADKLGQMLDALLTTKLAAIRAESDASLAAVRAEHETYRQQREADELAAAHRLIDTKVNAAIEDGYLSPGQKDRKINLLRTQDHVKVIGTLMKDGKETPATQLDMALDDLTAGDKLQSFGQRIPGAKGDPGTVTPERQRELLALGDGGRADLAYLEKLFAGRPQNGAAH